MKTTKTLNHFGFIGFGLIGGSIAHALRTLYPDSNIRAYNYYETRPHPKLEQALQEHTLSGISTDLADFAQCDVIFLCAPVLTNISYLKRLKPHLSPDCILTDVGSVKGNIETAIRDLGLGSQFVGGHPMTGSEKTGYANSNASYLKDAWYILTPTVETKKEYTEWMENFITAAGSHCILLDAGKHDDITAAISHCPHVISASLVNTVADRDTDGKHALLAAGGFKDITRISSSSPEMWQNICLTNPESICNFLDQYITTLTAMKTAIEQKDADTLTEYFSRAKDYRDQIK